MVKYQVISTKCPVINKAFRNKDGGMNGSPDLEVLVKLEDNEPTEVICPEYTFKKACAQRKKGCIYRIGWQTLE